MPLIRCEGASGEVVEWEAALNSLWKGWQRMSISPPLVDIAASAYRAYGHNRNWRDWRGGPMSQWDKLTPEIQVAWQAAAQQAINVYTTGQVVLDSEQDYAGWKPAIDGTDIAA